MDLKEYTITVSSKGEKLVKYAGGDFVVVEVVDSNDKKYSIPKLKVDGKITVAYEQIQKVAVGETITVGVDEQQKKSKDGKSYTARTIRSIKGDEYKIPYTKPATVNIETGEKTGVSGAVGTKYQGEVDRANFDQLEGRVRVLEGIVLKKEMDEDGEDGIEERNPGLTIDDLPF